MNTIKQSFCIVLLLTVASSISANKASPAIIDLMNVFNGIFTNREQVADEIARNSPTKHLLTAFNIQPVEIPALGQVPIVMQEFVFNGHVSKRVVTVLTESDNETITLKPYNFTGNLNSGPGQFDVKDLLNLTQQDFKITPGCNATFIRFAPGYYFLRWTDCTTGVNGEHRDVVTMRWSCCLVEMDVLHKTQAQAAEPYIMPLEGERYPLPSYLGDKGDGYICP